MAFMFESRYVLEPARSALLGTPPLQIDYQSHWLELRRQFDPARP